jgi:hypothetical protein
VEIGDEILVVEEETTVAMEEVAELEMELIEAKAEEARSNSSVGEKIKIPIMEIIINHLLKDIHEKSGRIYITRYYTVNSNLLRTQ